MQKEKFYITKKGFEKLKDSYSSIEDEIRKIKKNMGESAKIDNDLRENPEFMNLRVKAIYEMPAKKKKLHENIINAIIIENLPDYIQFDGDNVILGSKVVVKFDDEERTYIIAGTNEGDLANNIVACNSPIAKIILGLKVGDTVKFNEFNITILSVEKYIF